MGFGPSLKAQRERRFRASGAVWMFWIPKDQAGFEKARKKRVLRVYGFGVRVGLGEGGVQGSGEQTKTLPPRTQSSKRSPAVHRWRVTHRHVPELATGFLRSCLADIRTHAGLLQCLMFRSPAAIN